jgi:MFS family permease
MVMLVNLARVIFAPLVSQIDADARFSAITADLAGSSLTIGIAGAIATLAWVGSAAPRIPTGYLLTYVPRHWVILASGAVLTGAAAFTATVSSSLALALGALLMGVASGTYFIAANPLVSELFPEQVGRMIGIHGMASQIAAVIAPLLVGVIITRYDWQAVFVVIAGLAAVMTVAFFLMARQATLPDAGSEDRDLLGAVRRQWPIIVTGVAFIGTTGFVWNGVFNFYELYLDQKPGITEGTARTMLTLVFAAGVPAFAISGRLADRLPQIPLILTILGTFAVTLYSLTLVSTLPAIVVVSLVMGYTIHSLFPALDTYLLGSLPDENRASAYAVYSGTMMAVQAMGSVTVGTLRANGQEFDTVFRGFTAALVVVLVVLYTLHRLDWLPTDGHRLSGEPTPVTGD